MRFHKPAVATEIATGNNRNERVVTENPAQHQPLCFLGRRTLSKLYLMLHLGRMLSQGDPVRLDTINPLVLAETCYDHNGIEIHEFPDAAGLMLNLAETTGSRRLVDLAEPWCVPQEGHLVLVVDPDRNSMEAGFTTLAECGRQSNRFSVHRVYLDLCEFSRIGVRYLEGVLARHFPPLAIQGEWYALNADERDHGVILDNQHEDTLRLNRLSPAYRALLLELAKTCFGLSAMEATRCLRMADKTAKRIRAAQVVARR